MFFDCTKTASVRHCLIFLQTFIFQMFQRLLLPQRGSSVTVTKMLQSKNVRKLVLNFRLVFKPKSFSVRVCACACVCVRVRACVEGGGVYGRLRRVTRVVHPPEGIICNISSMLHNVIL